MHRPRVLVAAIAVAAIVLFAAGVIAWRMSAPGCPAGALCALGQSGSHQLHPRRAWLLWEASGVLLLVVLGLPGAGAFRGKPAAN
jgi:hypothetical protein